MNYLTGKGFIGTHLLAKRDAIHIPHDEIGGVFGMYLEPFEYFYFLSSYGNLASQNDKYMTYVANIQDVLDVRYAAERLNIPYKSFIYLSSSSVGLEVQTMYSLCKKVTEELLMESIVKYDRNICVIRPSSVTGVGEQSEHLIPILLRAAKSGATVKLDPSPSHDFIDVEDVVDGILTLGDKQVRGIYKLNSGVQYTNLEVLKLVEKITGSKIDFQIVLGQRSYDTSYWNVDGIAPMGWWMPKKSLEQSITEQWEALV